MGSLTIVGAGIHAIGDLTLAAQAHIERADKVLFSVADPVTAQRLRSLNKTAEALPYNRYYQRRRQTYNEIVEHILNEVRQNQDVCVVFYGHPGVFTDPAHEAIRQARYEGYKTQMLPGISAADCLFADLGLDPGKNGCQSFEATDFLIRRRKFDPCSALILWQIAMIGNYGFYEKGKQARGLAILVEVLERDYSANHQVTVYEAAVYPVCEPVIHSTPLYKLPEIPISETATLFVPPNMVAPLDYEMLARLDLSSTEEEV